ncbi:MAG: 3-oxoacyl-[acyl-carrier-protein] reductase FabG [Chlamydiae bacterium]|nr:3-oxoacyl-[acyl-carrier-protein] reductase FabG [Chlamydiota bacterium]
MILVTGGAKGLGAAMCTELAQRGHSLVIHYNQSQRAAEELAEKWQAQTIHGDFSTPAGVEAFIENYRDRFPSTQGLVNNVGNYLIASASKTTDLAWRDLFQINFFTPQALIQALLPSLKSVVNIGTAGLHSTKAESYATAYMATKAALWFLTRSLAKELAPEGVTVNMVSPGILETSIDIEKVSKVPMKRAASLKEAARLVGFLFEKESHYITGQNIEVAGGFKL